MKKESIPDNKLKKDSVEHISQPKEFFGNIISDVETIPFGILNLIIENEKTEENEDVMVFGVLAEEYKKTLKKGSRVHCRGIKKEVLCNGGSVIEYTVLESLTGEIILA